MPWPSRRRLILGISGEVYLLCDEFHGTLAAGAVHNTLATPGPGTRADPNNNTSVGNGVLLINSTTDICYFDEAVTRAAGMVYVAQITAAASTDMDVVSIGFDDAKTAAPDRCAIRFAASDVLQAVEDGTAVTIGSYAGQTSITVAFTLRATGAYFKVKLGTGAWKLYKIGNVNSTATLYAGVGGSGGAPAVSVAWHRVPAARWLDAPVCYDPFASDGALTTSATTGPDGQAVPARTWSGATWTVSGGNTPTLGAELGTDVDMEDNPASNWTAGPDGQLGNEAEERTGGAGSQCLSITNPVGGGYARAYQEITMAAGTWFELRGWIREVDDGGLPRVEAYEGANYYVAGINSTTSWVEYAATFRLLGANPNLSCRNIGNGASLESRADDFSIKPLTLSELVNVPDLSVADVVAEIEIAVNPAGTQAGLAIGWDSQASPANGILCYHDGTNVKVDKCVAGVYTTVQSTATAFSANAKLVCVRDGSSVSVFYNNALIGATQTISDAAILAATRHGAFSTSATPTMVCVAPMSGATWTVSGGKAVNTPTLGAELGTDVDMEDNPASNWTAGPDGQLGNEAEERTGGAGSQCLSITNPVGGGYARAYQEITMAAGTWFELRGWIREVDDGGLPRVEAYEGANYYVAGINSTTSWVEYAATFRLLGANPNLSCRNIGNGASLESRADDFSIKPLTLSELVNVPDLSVADVVAEIEIAVNPAGTQAGLAIGWDSQASPANGILVYHDGTNVKIDKNVAGTWTSVQSTATAFSANAKLVCVRDGSSVSVFYNNALIGSTQTISDAAILAATRHGMFSTNATPTMDNVLIMPRTGGNYSDLDRWSGVNP